MPQKKDLSRLVVGMVSRNGLTVLHWEDDCPIDGATVAMAM